MNTHRKQSRTPKPQPMAKQIERLQRDLKALGYTVLLDYGSGIYKPTITISIWPKDERTAA